MERCPVSLQGGRRKVEGGGGGGVGGVEAGLETSFQTGRRARVAKG